MVTGEARVSSGTEIVVVVDGHPITSADVAEAQVASDLERMRELLTRIVPDEQYYAQLRMRTPDPTPLAPGETRITDNSGGPIPESSGLREQVALRIALIERHGPEVVALGNLIAEAATYGAAAAAGHSADPAEVASYIRDIRAAFDAGETPFIEGYLSVVDEDVFFDEVLPERYARQLTIGSWRGALVADAFGMEEGQVIWHNAERDAVSYAHITVSSKPRLKDMGEQALAYLNEYFDRTAPEPAPLPPACANGTAVSDPNNQRGLVHDCEALLAAKDALMGTVPLNWSEDLAITSWDGVTTSGTPSRVTGIALQSRGLDGTIPPELGALSELTSLVLSFNLLTGSIPSELGSLANLKEVRLAGNNLTGCIPVAWEHVPANDLRSLGLLYCMPPAPQFPISTAVTRTSVTLGWNAVDGTSKYRVEHLDDPFGTWTIDDDTLTGTSHTVNGLACGALHQFRVSAYGSGMAYEAVRIEPSGASAVVTTAYETAWSEPSAAFAVFTLECGSGG